MATITIECERYWQSAEKALGHLRERAKVALAALRSLKVVITTDVPFKSS